MYLKRLHTLKTVYKPNRFRPLLPFQWVSQINFAVLLPCW